MPPLKHDPPPNASLVCGTSGIDPMPGSDHFCNPYVLGAAASGEPFLPVMTDATYITESVYSVYTAQAPVLTSAGPLPPTSAPSFQTLTGSAYLCQYSSTAVCTGEAGYCHSSSSTASIWGWNSVESNTVTLTDQGPVISSSVMTCHYATCAHADGLVSPCPPMFPSLAQGTPARIAHQGHSPALPYWEGHCGYCCHPHPLGPMLSGELSPYSQLHGSFSYMGSRTSTPQSDIPMELKDSHPTNEFPPRHSPMGMYYAETSETFQETNAQEEGCIPRMEPFHPHIASTRRARRRRRRRRRRQEGLMEKRPDRTFQTNNMGRIHGLQGKQNSRVSNGPSVHLGKNRHGALESGDTAPKTKVQRQNAEKPSEEQAVVCTLPASDSAKIPRPSTNAPAKPPTSRVSKTKTHGQKTIRRLGEEKASTAKGTHKRKHPEPPKETFKRARSSLAMHMMESVQELNALGEKHEKKPALPSSRDLGNAKDPTFCPANKSRLDSTCDTQSPKKFQPMKTMRNADGQGGSPRQCELPPPGKVRLVPLPFLSPEQPRLRPVCRRPQALASRRPSAADPARPPDTAQPSQVNTSRPTNASSCFMAPTKPPRPVSTKATLSGRSNQPQSTEPQVANARPAPPTSSSFTAQPRRPVPAAATKLHCPPKPPHHYLLQDFSSQPIPWRKAHIPGPAVSDPISQEQRPEREAMKRRAQQEREKAAQATFVGKVPFFQQRQVDMDISLHYGYAM